MISEVVARYLILLQIGFCNLNKLNQDKKMERRAILYASPCLRKMRSMAQNQHEHIIEHQREKQYLRSMLVDLTVDDHMHGENFRIRNIASSG